MCVCVCVFQSEVSLCLQPLKYFIGLFGAQGMQTNDFLVFFGMYFMSFDLGPRAYLSRFFLKASFGSC